MEASVVENPFSRFLKSKIPPSTKYLIKPGHQVRVCRELSRKWEGPFTVTKTSKKIITIADVHSFKDFNRNSVLRMALNINNSDLKHYINTIKTRRHHIRIPHSSYRSSHEIRSKMEILNHPRNRPSRKKGIQKRNSFAFVPANKILQNSNM